jgi:hypothetical protein
VVGLVVRRNDYAVEVVGGFGYMVEAVGVFGCTVEVVG